jgi:hypothetical protein
MRHVVFASIVFDICLDIPPHHLKFLKPYLPMRMQFFFLVNLHNKYQELNGISGVELIIQSALQLPGRYFELCYVVLIYYIAYLFKNAKGA